MKAWVLVTSTSISLAPVSPVAIPIVKRAEVNIPPFLEKDTAKSHDEDE